MTSAANVKAKRAAKKESKTVPRRNMFLFCHASTSSTLHRKIITKRNMLAFVALFLAAAVSSEDVPVIGIDLVSLFCSATHD